MIVVELGGRRSFQVPCPTQIVMDVSEGWGGRTRTVTRTPTVRASRRFAALEFPELPGGRTVNGPFGGELVVLVRELRGVTTIENALDHFALAEGIPIERSSDAIRALDCPAGKVVTIDPAEIGLTPGNTFVYLLLSARPAINLSPTYFLEFPWAELTLQ